MGRDEGRKTLQELEGRDWGEPSHGSRLVAECHRLRRVPLEDFAPEDLRLMIGQRIGLEHLVPMALETLSEDPLTEGDLYPGDLLLAVAEAPDGFWHRHPDLRERLEGAVRRALLRIDAPPDREDGPPPRTQRRLRLALRAAATGEQEASPEKGPHR